MIEVILIFIYIGSFTIGGGLVAITLIQEQLVERGYISMERLVDMISISESTPGPIGINMATFVGFELYGLLGAGLISLSFLLPSFVMIELLYKPLIRYQKTPLVKTIFLLIKAAVIGFLLYTLIQLMGVSLWPESRLSVSSVLIALSILILSKWIKKPMMLIVLGGIFGAILYGVGL